MILSTHALVGAAIGKNIDNPWIIILSSLAIHYFMDSFRHGEYFDSRTATIKNTAWKIIIDFLIGVFIVGLIISWEKINWHTAQNMAIGIFFSLFPDFITLLHWTFKKNKILAKIKDFHAWAHNYSRFPRYSKERQWTLRNSFNDVIFSLLAIAFLLI